MTDEELLANHMPCDCPGKRCPPHDDSCPVHWYSTVIGALREQRAALDPGWQPIETAPKDIEIDVWQQTFDSYSGDKLPGRRITNVKWNKDMMRLAVPALGGFSAVQGLTHWRPIPPPPEDLK